MIAVAQGGEALRDVTLQSLLNAPTGDELYGVDLAAVGSVDVRRGTIGTAWARDGEAMDVLAMAAQVAPQLFVAPRVCVTDESVPHEAMIVSRGTIHVFVRCSRDDRVIVGVARGGANLALVLSSLRTMKDSFGENVP